MHRGWRFCVGLCVVGVLCSAGRSEAAVITSISQFILPGFSTGSLAFVPASAPNNDNTATPSPNTFSTPGLGIFLNAGGFGILDYEFAVADSGGTTEYTFTTNVVNNTGVAWTDFHFELGFGTGNAFVPVAPGAGLDFDAPDGDPAAASSAFPTLMVQPTRLDWSGGTVNYLGGGAGPFSAAFTLAIDLPDGLAAMHPEGLSRFTLRSYPTATPVPEPTSATLVVVGLVGLVGRRSRRARAQRLR